jgi:D-serine deaminase-like pyridoxal phosphate-dependent protein
MARAPKLSFFLDGVEMAREAVRFARDHHVPLRVWVEIDCGGRRTGADPDGAALIEIGRVLSDPAVVFEGVATHAGQSYADIGVEAIRAVAEAERSAVVRAAGRLRAGGVQVKGVSAGSTPTAVHAASAEGLSEWRAGVYMAGDLYQALIRSMTLEDVALSVLAEVISHEPSRNQIVVDAGGLALSKDRSTLGLAGQDHGYGLICDLEGKSSFGRLIISETHQEHGVVRGDGPIPFERLPIGAKVRILPNHACMTAAAFESYLVVDGGLEIVDRWGRTNGWRVSEAA